MSTCPLCGSVAKQATKFSVTDYEAAQHFVLAEGDGERHSKLKVHIRSLWNASSCDVVECEECQLRYAWPFVPGDGEFYNLAFPHGDYPRAKWDYSITVTALEEFTHRGKRALEIGAGSGYFLQKICPRFFEAADVVAVEYSDIACNLLRQNDYTVKQQDIRSREFAEFENSFDTVFMFQVLEHMGDLAGLIERLRYITKETAEVFIAVPNPALIEFNENHRSLMDMPPNHISRWTQKSLVTFGARLGFNVVDFQQEPMSLINFTRQDLIASYLRRSQDSGTLANRLRSERRTSVTKLIEAGAMLFYGPSRLATWLDASGSGFGLGDSIWVHLRRA